MGSTENQYSRAVKGARLKFECICFVGSNPTAGIISVSSVGRAIVLLTIGRGFKSLTENNLISFSVKHLPLRDGEVSSTLTSDTSQLVQMVRIPSFHLGEPGSIPGLGIGSISPRGQRRGGRLPAMLDIVSLVQTQLLPQYQVCIKT